MLQKKYYLETNALYSLVNNIDTFVHVLDAATSLYALEEIVTGIDERQYHKRKVLLNKIVKSKLKIYPYFPEECLAISFGLDISQLEIVKIKKEILWKQVNLIISNEDYSMYAKKIEENLGIDLLTEKKLDDENNKDIVIQLNQFVKENNIRIKEKKKIKPRKKRIDLQKVFGLEKTENTYSIEKQILIMFLQKYSIDYEDSDIEGLIQEYDGNQLVAFILGVSLYMWDRSYNMKLVKRNDHLDLLHLLYLKGNNYVIVSDDKIFNNISLRDMRIKSNDFLKLCKK